MKKTAHGGFFMRKIKIAQIGMNKYSHGRDIFATMAAMPDLFQIVGYTFPENEREVNSPDALKKFENYREMTLEEILNDPEIEAVTVETEEIYLTKYAQMAADAGKHIHMEKPGGQDLRAFERLIDTVRKSGKVFHTGYMYRYNPLIADAIARAKSGELGHIYSVEAHMSRQDGKATRDWFSTFKGGMMFYLGCHLVDLVMQIQGVPDEVIPCNTVTGIDGVESEDFAFAVLKYPNATSVIRTGGTEVGGFGRRQLVICGEKGTIEIRPLERLLPNAETPYMMTSEMRESFLEADWHVRNENTVAEPFDRYMKMMSSFAAMVRGEIENPYTLDYELSLYKQIMKACGEDI